MALTAAQAALRKHLRAFDKFLCTTMVSACKAEEENKISWGWLMFCHSRLCGHRQVTDSEWPPSRMGRRQAHPAREQQSQSSNLLETPGPGERVGQWNPSIETWVSARLVEGQLYSPGLWLGSQASYFIFVQSTSLWPINTN